RVGGPLLGLLAQRQVSPLRELGAQERAHARLVHRDLALVSLFAAQAPADSTTFFSRSRLFCMFSALCFSRPPITNRSTRRAINGVFATRSYHSVTSVPPAT